MKVLHLTSGNLFGGIETMLVSIARHAGSEPGLDTQFAVCFDGRFRNELEASGAAVHCLGAVRARNPFGVRRARRVLERILDLEEIDVVICHSSWPLAIFGAAVKSSGRRLVLWQHAPNGGASWLEGWARQSRPELVIFNSEYTARTAKGIHASARRAVLHCPVTLHAVSDHLSASERAAVRADFDTRPDDVVIVQVSRLEEWKGHALHLHALSRMRDVDGWVCWMVGGAQRPAEERFFEKLQDLAFEWGIADRVRFLGQRADVPLLLEAADIHCQPNIKAEAFGITYVEALSAGLPVVATALGGATEIVDESCGILTSRPDVDEVAAALRRLVVDAELRARLGNAGPARARALCDPPQQLQRLHDILRPVLHRETVSA